jgi:hypothetical protein
MRRTSPPVRQLLSHHLPNSLRRPHLARRPVTERSACAVSSPNRARPTPPASRSWTRPPQMSSPVTGRSGCALGLPSLKAAQTGRVAGPNRPPPRTRSRPRPNRRASCSARARTACSSGACRSRNHPPAWPRGTGTAATHRRGPRWSRHDSPPRRRGPCRSRAINLHGRTPPPEPGLLHAIVEASEPADPITEAAREDILAAIAATA